MPRNRLRCVLVVFLYVTKVFSELVTKSSDFQNIRHSVIADQKYVGSGDKIVLGHLSMG